jgi:hypothetical protein
MRHASSASWRRENVPKAQGFIARTGYYNGTVGAGSQVQHTQQMSGECDHLLHARVSPKHNLILGIAMGTYELVDGAAPEQVANLGSGVHALEQFACSGIAKAQSDSGNSHGYLRAR